jgi:hypothetical protein
LKGSSINTPTEDVDETIAHVVAVVVAVAVVVTAVERMWLRNIKYESVLIQKVPRHSA